MQYGCIDITCVESGEVENVERGKGGCADSQEWGMSETIKE